MAAQAGSTNQTLDDNKGILMAFEGIDGAGKTTQIRALAQWLREHGVKVALLREPTDGPIGKQIRALAGAGRDACPPEEEFRLFREDRRWNVETNILPALGRGEVVLLDRYYISSMAYQGALGLDPERIRRENEAFAPRPNRIYMLDLPPAFAQDRIRQSRGESPNLFERAEYLTKVSRLFHSFQFEQILWIDATQPPEKIQEILRDDAAKLIGLPE